VGKGDKWLTSRLFISAIMMQRMLLPQEARDAWANDLRDAPRS
jgi:hypothetical protein